MTAQHIAATLKMEGMCEERQEKAKHILKIIRMGLKIELLI